MSLCLAPAVSLLAGAAASAQPLACPELAAIVDSAETYFAPIRGPLRSSIMPGSDPLRRVPAQGAPDQGAREKAAREFEKRVLSTKFEVHSYATTRPLAGAESCEIRLTIKEDARSASREATYHCNWPSSEGFAALKRSLVSCLASAAIGEDKPESLRLDLRRVSPAEGELSVRLSIGTGATQSASLSATKSVCLERSPGGCGESR